MMIVLSLTPIMNSLKQTQNISSYDEDIYLGVKQLSQYTMGTYYVQHGSSYTYLNYQGEEVNIVLDNHRLVKKPGFEILMSDIDSLSFEQKDQWIYMHIVRNKRKYTFLLTYKREKQVEDNENQEIE